MTWSVKAGWAPAAIANQVSIQGVVHSPAPNARLARQITKVMPAAKKPADPTHIAVETGPALMLNPVAQIALGAAFLVMQVMRTV